MRAERIVVLAISLACAHAAAVAENASASSTVSSSSGQASASSEVSFSGSEGKHIVNGDVIEVRGGQLMLNGRHYATVDSGSSIRYSVQGSSKRLFVDGKEIALRK